MKASIIAFAIFILMVFVAMLDYALLDDIMDQIAQPLEKAEALAAEGDLDRAEEEFYNSKRVWDEKNWLIEITVNCGHLYETSTFYSEAETALVNGEVYDFVKNSRLLRLCVEDSISEQHLNMRNLF